MSLFVVLFCPFTCEELFWARGERELHIQTHNRPIPDEAMVRTSLKIMYYSVKMRPLAARGGGGYHLMQNNANVQYLDSEAAPAEP